MIQSFQYAVDHVVTSSEFTSSSSSGVISSHAFSKHQGVLLGSWCAAKRSKRGDRRTRVAYTSSVPVSQRIESHDVINKALKTAVSLRFKDQIQEIKTYQNISPKTSGGESIDDTTTQNVLPCLSRKLTTFLVLE